MGRRYSGRNMGDPAVDLEKTIMPVACAGGIYDFSGTQANYVYAESGVSITQEEIQYLTKAWWDGKSDGWSDEDFNALLGSGEYKPTLGGENYAALRRNAFGDGDACHSITLKSKTPGSKKGAVVAHSDYTCCVGVFDDDKGQVPGPLTQQEQTLIEAYKDAGY